VTNDPLSTALTAMLGCRLPVIQTAMGWIAEPQLVAATAEAGGFGFLGAAVMSPVEAARKIADLRRRTSRAFGVNFHMFQPGAEELVDLIIANKVQIAAVSFGRGPDARMIGRFRDVGIRCVPTVGALKHARKMEQLGVDMIVVQGGEGGGHTGSVASTVLLPQVLDAVRVPVVAAGGFADGRGLAAALAFGAAGIAMGTRFLMTRESPVPDSVKAQYVAAQTDDILVTDRIDGMPQRMIRNGALRQFVAGGWFASWRAALRGALAMKRESGASYAAILRSARAMQKDNGMSLSQAARAASAPSLIRLAVVEGDCERGLMATGQVAGRVGDLPSVGELLARIERDARACIAQLAGVDAPVPVRA
jgi:NAD(P)H-dependent flavin oxidoreductase YrpB (nitropropane dioxygenase family)